MPKPFSFADVELDVSPRPKPRIERPEPEAPFRILVIGDFSGRGAGGRPVLIDRDNFDDVMDKLGPELSLPNLVLPFRELDDFHPDSIFERAELFQQFRATRANLANPATFAGTAPPRAEQPHPPGKITFGDIVEADAPAPPQQKDEWERLVHELVTPHLVPGAEPRQAQAIAHLDLTAAELMRAVLHNPAFQALESAWRGLYFLVRRVETGADLKLYLLDIPKAEMAAMLERSRDDLRQSDFYRLAVQETSGTPGAERWSLFAADYYFDAGEQSLETLARLGVIAHKAGAPFIAGAGPALLANRAGGGWPMLRKLPYANCIGLAMPRFLLRLPYGKETSPVEQFAFEEMPEHDHEDYLWGNAAFVCACLHAQAFSEAGWRMRPGSHTQIDGLPLHVYSELGEPKAKPCAEVLMTEEQAEALLDNGIMPLMSYKNRDIVRLLRLQSIADPPAELAGRWG